MPVRVVTDSASSTTDEDAERLSITTVPLRIAVAGVDLSEQELREPAFYERLARMPQLPQTSQPSPEDFVEVFRRLSSGGDDILAVLISAGMSGTIASADVAARAVSAESGARIEIVDSRSNSLEEGFAVLAAAQVAAEGAPIEACVKAAEETTRRTRFLFAPQSLEYLHRGGRISGAARLLGVMLKIAPILTAEKGSTGVAGVARSGRAAWSKIGSIMRRDVERYGLRRAAVQYVSDRAEAERFAAAIVGPVAGGEVPVVAIHPVVGLHVGPAVGVVYETERPMRYARTTRSLDPGAARV